MTWDWFPWIAGGVLALWGGGVLLDWRGKNGGVLVLTGAMLLFGCIAWLWGSLGRPPLWTLGETRLWYAALLPLAGLLLRWRWEMKWPLSYTVTVAAIFLLILLRHPETVDRQLPPALQSPWFVPHVVVYLTAYALLTGASLAGMRGVWFLLKKKAAGETQRAADVLTETGFAFLTMGLLFGALWAKEAWGHYWTWDPKETWAFLTWAVYLVYLHLRMRQTAPHLSAFVFLSLAWVVLLVCWFGLQWLPAARASVHVFGY